MGDLLILLLYFLLPLVFTILIEGLAAAILKFKRTEQLLLLRANLVTNPVLNLILLLISIWDIQFPMAVYLLEICVVIAEGFWLFRKTDKGKLAFLYALVINGISYGCGLLLGALIC